MVVPGQFLIVQDVFTKRLQGRQTSSRVSLTLDNGTQCPLGSGALGSGGALETAHNGGGIYRPDNHGTAVGSERGFEQVVKVRTVEAKRGEILPGGARRHTQAGGR